MADEENPAEKPAETPAEIPAETPAETPAEPPTEAPAETPTETPAEAPAETTAETPGAETPTETPPAEAAKETPTATPAEVSVKKEAPADEEAPAETAAPASTVATKSLTPEPTAETPEENSNPNKKNCAIVVLVIVGIIIIITILTRTLAEDEEDDGTVGIEGGLPVPTDGKFFNRIASFPVCQQLEPTCNTDIETNAQIVYATEDGMKIIYTDPEMAAIGILDIEDPANPTGLGFIAIEGEPTSTVIYDNYAVVAVDTSDGDFVDPSGLLLVIDLNTTETVHTIDLGGQPKSVAISPDKTFMAVAIENQHDPSEDSGELPQYPAGFLVVIDSSSSDPTEWSSNQINLTDLDGVGEESDPEPEHVDINSDNVCVVTLLENNAIVVIDLPTLEFVSHFSAGVTDLKRIDVEDDGIITFVDDEEEIPREPDGVTWIGTEYFATADAGGYEGGSRGFTIYTAQGDIMYTSEEELDYWAIRLGHYEDGRSDNRGNEPDFIGWEMYGDLSLLFVTSKRSHLVFVYEVTNIDSPELLQILPAGIEPEGSFAISSRNLLVVASEEEDREDKSRSNIAIYERQEADTPNYPYIMSKDREDGLPRPFSALSALTAKGDLLYTVEDSAFIQNRIFAINTTSTPYTIIEDWRITDSGGVLASALSEAEAVELLNDDKDQTVNLDVEGIAAIDGGFWLCSEGAGNFNDTDTPYETPNLLIRVNEKAMINTVIRLPPAAERLQVEYGFEGIAVDGDHIIVTFEREWQGEDDPRIGIYDTIDRKWKFVYYPVDRPISQFVGWVGLSDIAAVGDGKFLIVERDNHAGPDAAVKRLYSINLGDFSMEDGSTITGKQFIRDLIPDLKSGGGLVVEDVGGVAVDEAGQVWINTDNKGVDDTNGENLLLNLGDIL